MFVQMAIGIVPVLLIFLLMSIFSKRYKARNISMTVISALVSLSFFVVGLTDKKVEEKIIPKVNEIRFAYVLVDEGATELADEVIRSARTNGTYTETNTLARARVALLEGKIQAARALYNKLPESEESKSVMAIPLGIARNSEEYKTAMESAKKAVKKEIISYLNEIDEEGYDEAAQIAAEAEQLYSNYLGDESQKPNTTEFVKDLEKLYKKTPELLAVAPLRIARLKLQLLSEDFKGIAASVDDYADYNELLIVSELYMNGYIKPSNFSYEYRGADLGDYTAVVNALEDVYYNYYSDKPREERNAAKAQIRALKAFMKNPSLIKVETALADYAESEFAYDKSKVYLQLAKTESYMGNPQKSVEYLDKSLNTVGDCDDAEYTTPMYEIIGIIADKDDPERLKDVAVYTDKILTNTMTVKMSTVLREPSIYDDLSETTDFYQSENATENSAETSKTIDFGTQVNTYVTQKRMAVNIIDVDVSEFDTVKANINISGDLTYSLDELKSKLNISDCDIDIKNFDLQKITYTGANILICADVSGSMEGQPIEDLRNAVKMFVESTDAIESVALVTFNNSISGVWGFGTPNPELISAAESLRSGGGTNMYDAVQTALSYFSTSGTEISCVILISDGEDNNPASLTEITENVGQPYRTNKVTLYSLGLGNVAADYLNALAGSTGGKYTYASDSIQIQNLFDGIRSQILNSYLLTFKAEDTIQNSRNLRVALNDESYVYDEHWYSLDGSDAGTDLNEQSVVYLEGKALYGFTEKLIFKSERSRKLDFKGTGFENTDSFTFSLEGHINYDHLAYEYKDSETVSVTIPAGIACDTYDVRVSVNGKKTVLVSGLTVVVQGSEKLTEFGDYVFTSYFKHAENGKTTLSQYVQMNGWLNFKGDVDLTGDLKSESIVMSSYKPQYIHYYPDTAEGLAASFVNKDVSIPAIGEITLYNQYLFAKDEIRVEPVPVASLGITGFLTLSTPGLSLYPDRLEINANSFTTDLPFQKQILRGVGLFTFDINIGGAFGAKSIDFMAEVSAESGDDKGALAKNPINLGNIPVLLNTSEFELKLNTYENEFYVKYIAALPFITDDPKFGASVGWKWGDKSSPGILFDELMFYADFDVPLAGSPIDLKFSDFKFGFKGMTDDNPLLTGGFDASSYNLKRVLPGIANSLGDMADMSLLLADDTEINFGLKDFYIKAKTNIKLLKYIELGGVKLELGKFKYTNKLLGLTDETVLGFSGKINAGPQIHVENCDIAINGEIELTGTNRFAGIGAKGNVDIAVNWWILTKDFHKQGSAVLGVQFTHDGDTVFLAKASDGKDVFFIQWSKRRGGDVGTTKV